MSQISMTRPDLRRAGVERLGGADMSYLQARVVCGQLQVRAAGDGDRDLKSNLTGAKVGQRSRIVQRGHQTIPVADGEHLDGRAQRRALVDDDLARRTREGTQGGDPPAAD